VLAVSWHHPGPVARHTPIPDGHPWVPIRPDVHRGPCSWSHNKQMRSAESTSNPLHVLRANTAAYSRSRRDLRSYRAAHPLPARETFQVIKARIAELPHQINRSAFAGCQSHSHSTRIRTRSLRTGYESRNTKLIWRREQRFLSAYCPSDDQKQPAITRTNEADTLANPRFRADRRCLICRSGGFPRSGGGGSNPPESAWTGPSLIAVVTGQWRSQRVAGVPVGRVRLGVGRRSMRPVR